MHADFVRIPEETTYAPEHSVDGFTDEYVSDIDWDPEVKFPDSEVFLLMQHAGRCILSHCVAMLNSFYSHRRQESFKHK